MLDMQYKEEHGSSCGNEILKCANCRGNHIPTSPECPIVIKNLEVLKIMAHENVSYMDARAQVFGKKAAPRATIENFPNLGRGNE